MVTASLVKELREKTGAGMMDCKKVLTETDGNMEKAMELLRERGIAKAAKKSGRIAAEGLVDAYISEDGKIGAVVEVNSETDFVAQNSDFKTFVMNVAKQVVDKNPKDVEELLAQPAEFEEGKTVQESLVGKIATIGENLSIRRFARFESEGLVAKYIHGDGKIAVLVNMPKGTEEVAKDICMQIAAARPEYVRKEEVPAERVEKEMEILKIQTMNEGKPEAIAEKIVQGRIGKFYEEICLVDQAFVKDPNKKVSQLLVETNSDVAAFARLENELSKLKLVGFSLDVHEKQINQINAVDVDVVLEDESLLNVNPYSSDCRNYGQVKEMILNSSLSNNVKILSRRIFDVKAAAEARVHHVPIDEVKFHEAGAIDSIVDIVGASICYEYLKIDKAVSKKVPTGFGKVKCACGVLDIPAPAVKQILGDNDIPHYKSQVKKELLTPTGASILAVVVDQYGFADCNGKVISRGYGIGKRKTGLPPLELTLCVC